MSTAVIRVLFKKCRPSYSTKLGTVQLFVAIDSSNTNSLWWLCSCSFRLSVNYHISIDTFCSMMIQSVGVHKVTAHRASQHHTPHTERSSILMIYSDENLQDPLCQFWASPDIRAGPLIDKANKSPMIQNSHYKCLPTVVRVSSLSVNSAEKEKSPRKCVLNRTVRECGIPFS